MDEIKNSLEILEEFLNYFLHPVQTFAMFVEWVISYVPAVICILMILYAITDSPKIIRVVIIIIALFVFLSAGIAWVNTDIIVVIILVLLLLSIFGRIV